MKQLKLWGMSQSPFAMMVLLMLAKEHQYEQAALTLLKVRCCLCVALLLHLCLHTCHIQGECTKKCKGATQLHILL